MYEFVKFIFRSNTTGKDSLWRFIYLTIQVDDSPVRNTSDLS